MSLWGTLFWVVNVVCIIWVIWNISTKHTHWKRWHKVAWAVFAILFGVIAAIVYYFTEYKKK